MDVNNNIGQGRIMAGREMGVSKMRTWRTLLVTGLCAILLSTAACSSGGSNPPAVVAPPAETNQGSQTVHARGYIEVETAYDVNLSFGVGGKIDKIMVKMGDKVARGDMLAMLETDALELAVTQAEVALNEAQVNEQQAKYDILDNKLSTELEIANSSLAVTRALDNVSAMEVGLRQAEHDAQKTEDLNTWDTIREAKADLEDAKRYLDRVKTDLAQAVPGSTGEEALQKALLNAQARLNTARDKFDAIVGGLDPDIVAIRKMQVDLAQQSIAEAQQSLQVVRKQLDKINVTAPELSAIKASRAELAEKSLSEAQQSLSYARNRLAKATITAPFDGVIAGVYADAGNIVASPDVNPETVLRLINLSHMELKVEVEEIDIPKIETGQRVMISIDALPDTELTGEVTSIAPATEEVAGVVLYEVKVSFEAADETGIKPGMSATANIKIG
jgi:HlyD family secretion protein